MVFVFDFDWVNHPGARWPRPRLLCAGSRVKRPRWLFWLIDLSFCLTSNIYVVCTNTSCNQQSKYRSSWLCGPSCHLCWPCRLSGGCLLSVNTKHYFTTSVLWNICYNLPAACQIGGSWVSTQNMTMLHGYYVTFAKIFMAGHSQRDHPQLCRGQGQHHRGVDASKCHVRRGRLPGDLFTIYSSIVVVKAEEAYNVYL